MEWCNLKYPRDLRRTRRDKKMCRPCREMKRQTFESQSTLAGRVAQVSQGGTQVGDTFAFWVESANTNKCARRLQWSQLTAKAPLTLQR